MKVIDRYVGLTLLKGFALVLVALVALFSIAALVEELDDVGRGTYTLTDAIVYVGLRAAGRAVQLASVSAFLGGLLTLGSLAASNELVAMRAVGTTTRRLALASLLAGVPVMIAVSLAAEFVVPTCDQRAFSRRSIAIARAPALWSKRGFWFKDGDSLTRVGGILHGRTPTDVEIFSFDPHGRLRTYVTAERAELRDDDRWELANADVKTLGSEGVRSTHEDLLPWKTTLDEAELGIVQSGPEALAPTDLLREIRRLRRRGQDARSYELALWQKLSLPLATAVMILMVLPFVLGRPRSASLGRRLVLGTVVGTAAWLLDGVVGKVGYLAGAPPALTALLPPALILAIALGLLSRLR